MSKAIELDVCKNEEDPQGKNTVGIKYLLHAFAMLGRLMLSMDAS